MGRHVMPPDIAKQVAKAWLQRGGGGFSWVWWGATAAESVHSTGTRTGDPWQAERGVPSVRITLNKKSRSKKAYSGGYYYQWDVPLEFYHEFLEKNPRLKRKVVFWEMSNDQKTV